MSDLNRKTTKGNLVSVDLIQYYYTRHDVQDYVWLTNNEWRVYFDIWRDYIKIDDTDLDSDEISYILWNDDWKESFEEETEQRQFEINMEEKLKWKTIQYLYVRDYGSWWLSCVQTSSWNCNWFIIYNEEISEDLQKEFYENFRAYIEWEFYSISIYSPKEYIAKDWDKLIEWIYEDSEQFFKSKSEALGSVDTLKRWRIIKESERSNFSYYERP